MKSYTMRPFDYKKAYENRFSLDIKKGDVVICKDTGDGVDHKYQVIEITIPEDKVNLPHYVLTPIEETLKREQKLYDNLAKINRHSMTIGEYPDFSFEIESTWFFSRDVVFEER